MRVEEVSWLGVVNRGRLPSGASASGLCRDLTTYSCGGSAGIAPDFPVSSRVATLA
jgi:hypothetical protein